jgi:hypothetical protein
VVTSTAVTGRSKVNLTEIATLLENIQLRLSDNDVAKCTRLKNGKCCTQHHEDERDDDGRPVFYYGDECRVVAEMCPACRAYWHVAVARNALFDLARVSKVA